MTLAIMLATSCAAFALAAPAAEADGSGPSSALPSDAAKPEAQPAPIPVEEPAGDPSPPPPESNTRRPIGEIVVTARRTEESLQEVPMSISVMDSTQMAERGITTFHDLTTSVPGLTGGEGQQTAYKPTPIFSIRGQGEATPGSAPGVVPYFGEVPEFTPFLYDVRSVQVLKGPQGTLFGKNSTGGAVLFEPVKPTEEVSGYVNTTIGNYDAAKLNFAVGGGLVDGLLCFRIAGQRLRRDGYTVDHRTGQDFQNEHRESYRASLLFTPFDEVESLTIVQYDDMFENGNIGVLEVAPNSDPTAPYWAEREAYLAQQRERGPYSIESDEDAFIDYEGKGLINNSTWNLNDRWSFKNIGSISELTSTNLIDIDGSSFKLLSTGLLTDGEIPPIKTWSDEFQVQYRDERYFGIVGVFYQSRRQKQSYTYARVGLPGSTSALPILLTVELNGNSYPQRDRSAAAFANLQISDILVDGLSLTLGLRQTHDYRKSKGAGYVIEPTTGAHLLAIVPEETVTLKYDETTWTVSLDYRWTDDWMTYASARRGYKAGGFNTASNSNVPLTYDPESVVSLEVGTKSQWPLHKGLVQVNADVYRDDYRDIQRYSVVPGIPLDSNSVLNAARATILGVDLETLLAPVDWFDLAINYAYLKTEYQKYEHVTYGDVKNSKFPNAPTHQYTVVPRVHADIPQWGEFSASLNWFWQAKTYFTIPNVRNGNPDNDEAIGGSAGSSFHRLGFRADWRSIGGTGFSAGAFVLNLTDETYRVGSVNFLGSVVAGNYASFFYGAPRTYGLDVRYDF